MKNITTGVDRLLRLVEEKRKVSSEAAAKELSLSKEVVEEWAEILEQEKIVKLSFKLSKMFIESKKITEKTVFNSAKQITEQKEAFHRKIEVTIKAIDNETAGFDEVRLEFEKIQGHIKDELETVRREMKELERFDRLKKTIEKNITGQKKDYEAFTKLYDKEVEGFEKNYTKSIDKLKKEQKTLNNLQNTIVELRSDKIEIEKVIAESIDKLKVVASEANSHLAAIKTTEKTIDKLKKDINDLTSNIEVSKAKNLKILTRIVGKKREEIEKEHNDLLSSAQLKISQLKDYADAGEKIYEKFSSKFMKKIKTGDLITEIKEEKEELRNELVELDKKVQLFSALKVGKDVKDQFEKIEKKIFSYEEKKRRLSEKINRLLGFIKS